MINSSTHFFSPRRFPGAGILAAILAGALLAPGLPASAQSRRQVVGAVFTQTNNAARNLVVMYPRLDNGELRPAGRFETGGRGSGGTSDPLHSQGTLVLNADHSRLYAVNAGSGDLSVFAVSPDQLTLLQVVPCGGSTPISLALSERLLYVVNFAGNYHLEGFTVLRDGRLRPVRGSETTLSGSPNTGVSTVGFTPDGQKLVATERITNKIDVFTVDADGRLSQPVFNDSVGADPFGFVFTAQGVLVVSEATNAVPPSTTSSYTINPDNTLKVVTAAATSSGVAGCWVAATDKYVWVANTGTGDQGLYGLGANGALTPLGATGGLGPNSFPVDSIVSADGQYFYGVYNDIGELAAFRIGESGQLVFLNAVFPQPAKTGEAGLAGF